MEFKEDLKKGLKITPTYVGSEDIIYEIKHITDSGNIVVKNITSGGENFILKSELIHYKVVPTVRHGYIALLKRKSDEEIFVCPDIYSTEEEAIKKSGLFSSNFVCALKITWLS